MAVDAVSFKATLARFAAGVTVVTVRGPGGALRGMTATAFSSVSLEPPLVLVCVGRAGATHDLIGNERAFAVNLLAVDQSALSDRFSGRRDSESFSDLDWRPAPMSGAPLLQGALGWVDCSLHAAYDGGDHTIFVGAVEYAAAATAGPLPPGPLLYFLGRHHALGEPL